MVGWYIVSTIFLVIGTVMVIWGAYNLYCGIRYEDPHGDFRRGIQKWAFAAFLGMVLWAIGFPWGGEWFEWIKVFVAEHGVILRIAASVVSLMIGLPLIGIILALTKFLFIDTRK